MRKNASVKRIVTIACSLFYAAIVWGLLGGASLAIAYGDVNVLAVALVLAVFQVLSLVAGRHRVVRDEPNERRIKGLRDPIATSTAAASAIQLTMFSHLSGGDNASPLEAYLFGTSLFWFLLSSAASLLLHWAHEIQLDVEEQANSHQLGTS